LRLAAQRKGENDNYLYCPSRQDIEDVEDKDGGGLAHFQKHWVQGEPIIVCDVLEAVGGCGLSWEPMVVWRAARETTKKKLERKTVAAIDCLNWQEVKKRICSRFAAQLCPNIPPTLKEHA
jgi:lysine-specific demethylase 3